MLDTREPRRARGTDSRTAPRLRKVRAGDGPVGQDSGAGDGLGDGAAAPPVPIWTIPVIRA